MEDIFLPIANLYVKPIVLWLIGLVGGMFSSMLGIGGGIVINPILMMIGIPSFIAVPSQLGNAIGTNLSGFLTYWRQRDVDFSLAWYLLTGSILGGISELFFLRWAIIKHEGIALSKILTVIILIVLSLIVLYQSINNMHATNRQEKGATMRHWMIYFPWHKIFLRSRTEMSILVPLSVGFLTGAMTSSLGGSSSLLTSPILTYLIGRTSPVVAGTSMLAGFGINLFMTFLYGVNHAPVDFILLFFLLVGSICGTIVGAKISYKIPRYYLGIAGGVTLLCISGKFLKDLYDAGWQHRHTKNYFEDSFANIMNNFKLDSDVYWSKAQWIKHIVNFAYQDPFGYTIAIILIIIILVSVLQMIIYRLLKGYR